MPPADCTRSRRTPASQQQAGVFDPDVRLPGNRPTYQHSDFSVEWLLIEPKWPAGSMRDVQIRVSIRKNVVGDDGILVMCQKILEVFDDVPVREMLQHILAN